MTEYPVKLKVYDLSKGMALRLSPILVGKTIEGVWHTSVLVYGMEYFYGGSILCTDPYDFEDSYELKPVNIIDMGKTEVDENLFHDYLDSIRKDFTADNYNIIHWNCNNFTNEVCKFLVGKKIPDYILNLPQEVMSTGQGKFLLNLIQSYQNNIAPGAENIPNQRNLSNSQKNLTGSQKNLTDSQKKLTDSQKKLTDSQKNLTKENIDNKIKCDNFNDLVNKTENIEKHLKELLKDKEFNINEGKKLFNSIINIINKIITNVSNIKYRIIDKNDHEKILNNLNNINSYAKFLMTMGFFPGCVEMDPKKKIKKIIIFINPELKCTKHLDLLFDKDIYLKKDKDIIYIVNFRHLINFMFYSNENCHMEKIFIFVSMCFIYNCYDFQNKNNDVNFFNNIIKKIKINKEDDKKNLLYYLETIKKCLKELK